MPAEARYCFSCGQAVLAGADTGPADRDVSGAVSRSYTPRHLAERILSTRSAVEGERKRVTVLFADVKESMALAEKVDPEKWHEILDGFFAILAEGVHRFEGTVNQYTGDGIMALFGAPIAHEDHAQRSCYAALYLSEKLSDYATELRRSEGLNFSVRMGINSGEVVVGRIGDDLRMDYTAQGHTVGLAARMESLAAPGCIYVTEHTRSLVAGYFRFRDLGLFDLKGVSDPVAVFELQATGELRTRFDLARERGLSRFVGRHEEMAHLDRALQRAAEGDAGVVGVVAQAGTGKSRLCYEFIERCRVDGVPVYEAHCLAHGRMVPLLPVLELLRSYFGVGEEDGAQEAREKIAGRLLLLDEGMRETLPLVLDFMGVSDASHPLPPIDAELRQQRLFACLEKLIRARGKTMVLLIEDLHWIDGASDFFLARLVRMLKGTNALLLLNFRPEYQAQWMNDPGSEELALSPLGPEAIDALLCELLCSDPALRPLAAAIRQKAEGNPFFIEETGSPSLRSGALDSLGNAWNMAGRFSEATPCLRESLEVARKSRTLLQGKPLILANLCEALRGEGCLDEAVEAGRQAVELATQRRTLMAECRARLFLGRALLARDGEATALAALEGEEGRAGEDRAKAIKLFRDSGAVAHARRLESFE